MKATHKESGSAHETIGRVDGFDWARISRDLDAQGCAQIERLFSPDECRTVASMYPDEVLFRTRVVMARHGFGRGEYKYFSYLRTPRIAGTRRWASMSAILKNMPASSGDATTPVRFVRRHYCYSTAKAITTAFIRICTGNMSSRFRSPFSCPSRERTLPAASSC
jgi:hypothetical protein